MKWLPGEGAAANHVVDNLLSAERLNVPDSSRVRFTEASLADPRYVATRVETTIGELAVAVNRLKAREVLAFEAV